MNRITMIALIMIFFSSCNKTEDINNNILKLYGDALEDIGYSITRTDDGLIMAGQLTTVARIGTNYIDSKNSKKKMGVIKTGIDGNVIWQKSFGDKLPSVGTKGIVLDDGSVVCAGYIVDTLTQLKDVFVVKTNNLGEVTSQKIYKTAGDIANQYSTDIIKTPEGFLILGVTDAERQPITDSTGNEAGKKDILLMRISSTLDVISTSATGFPGDDEGVAIKEDIGGGGFIVAGTTDRSDKPLAIQGSDNILLLRVNTLGKDTQYRILGGTAEEYAADIDVQSDGYIIAGTVGADGQDQYGYVWKMSQNIFASPVYEHPIKIESSTGTAVSFKINAISRYKTSSYVMAGQSGKGSLARMLIFLTDDEGNLLPEKVVYNGGTGSQAVYDVISDDGGNVFAVGKNSYETNSMMSLLKFRF
jgi:hypothetical protein